MTGHGVIINGPNSVRPISPPSRIVQGIPRMNIQVNGAPHEVSEGMTVQGLLRELQINVAQVAVEINLEILNQQDFDARRLCDGDRIEIMGFIGGGHSVAGRDLLA